jgi:glucosamine--fructose-6-phosphate aminotransferase (isomerizing)
MMTEKKVRESTLDFGFNKEIYEAAWEHPTYYTALKRTPRKEHPFNTYDDIYRQPNLIRELLKDVRPHVKKMVLQILERNIERVLFTGIGASYNLGVSASHLIWRLTKLPAYCIESSQYPGPLAAENAARTLVIGLSASGNSLETVQHFRAAREEGSYTIAFTNLENTRLTDAAHEYYVAPGGFGLVWDLTTRLVALAALALELGYAMGQPSDRLDAVNDALDQIPDQMDRFFETMDTRCQGIGQMMSSMRAAVIPATDIHMPTALEMALRFEEMAHLPARGRTIVDFLHGGVGYLDSDICTFLFAPEAEKAEYAKRAARVTREVKSPCIVIANEDEETLTSLADWVVRIPITHPDLTPLLYVLPAQLIPYYTEVVRPGGNPDTQRTDQPRYARAFDVAFPPKSH